MEASSATQVRGVAGLLLTGGASRRMGVDKATLLVDGVPAAVRLRRVLSHVADPVFEVGPGVSGAASVQEDEPGSGPLAAVAAGAEALTRQGHEGPALVVACDLPLVDDAVLRTLATWPGGCSVVPVVGGRPQPLCARWARSELEAAVVLVAEGVRAMRALLERPSVVQVPESSWPPGFDPGRLADTDTPEDLVRLGVVRPHRHR